MSTAPLPTRRRLLCILGVHGPNWYGPEHGRTGIPFQRECPHCGKKWYGTQVETRYVRTIGDFRTEAQLRKSGEWREPGDPRIEK